MISRAPTVALLTALVAALLGALAPGRAAAQRFAVVIGNNAGHRSEPALEFAERDASRVAEVLTSVGGVRPERLILVQGGTASAARQALITTNERIRGEASDASMLVVYYSGHGDAASLHLGDTSLPLSELEGLVRGSAARLRVLIIDACRSGAVTRTKGGTPAPAIRLALTQASGVVVLTASAAGESAQESPALGASFFTHHLLSGLLGAADVDRDGRVTITEAYEYAYSNTLRDSSATLAGMQHPSYRYDVRGQGDVALTTLRAAGARAQLVVPPGLDVLVMRGSATGAVIAEARTPAGSSASLSLPPGRLFVRARTAQAMFEQEVTLRPGQTLPLSTAAMDRIELARLARKGGTHVPFVAGVGVSILAHAGVADRGTYCTGAGVHGSLVYRSISVTPRLGACREQFSTDTLETETTELQAAVGVNVHRDLSRRWSAQVGPELGLAYYRQGVASSLEGAATRNLVGGVLTVQGGVDLDVGGGFAIGARATAGTSFLELDTPTRPSARVSAVFTWGAALGVIRYFR